MLPKLGYYWSVQTIIKFQRTKSLSEVPLYIFCWLFGIFPRHYQYYIHMNELCNSPLSNKNIVFYIAVIQNKYESNENVAFW